MRTSILGLGAALVIGASLIALPPTLASATSNHATKTVAVKTTSDSNKGKDKGKDKDDKGKGKGDGDDKGGKCKYPVNTPSLSLSAKANDGSGTFTGTLRRNKCDLGERQISIYDSNGKLVGSGTTNGDGHYTIKGKAVKGETYTAVFKGTSKTPGATSNSVKIKWER